MQLFSLRPNIQGKELLLSSVKTFFSLITDPQTVFLCFGCLLDRSPIDALDKRVPPPPTIPALQGVLEVKTRFQTKTGGQVCWVTPEPRLRLSRGDLLPDLTAGSSRSTKLQRRAHPGDGGKPGHPFLLSFFSADTAPPTPHPPPLHDHI